jgi:hypothetical protein
MLPSPVNVPLISRSTVQQILAMPIPLHPLIVGFVLLSMDICYCGVMFWHFSPLGHTAGYSIA